MKTPPTKVSLMSLLLCPNYRSLETFETNLDSEEPLPVSDDCRRQDRGPNLEPEGDLHLRDLTNSRSCLPLRRLTVVIIVLEISVFHV